MNTTPISTPNPDPTTLTTAALMREVVNLRDIIETRLDGMDKTMEDVKDSLRHRGDAIAGQLGNLKELQEAKELSIEEKFKSVEKQFAERDVRSDKTAELNQKALDAALLTAEKAVTKQQESFTIATTKSELSFTKQIEALGVQLTTITKTSDDKFSDIRQSISRLDTAIVGIASRATGHGETWGWVVAGIVIVGVLIDVFTRFAK